MFTYRFKFPNLEAEGEVTRLLSDNFFQRNFQLQGDGTLYRTGEQMPEELIKKIEKITGYPVEDIAKQTPVQPALV